jgi:hypothetical protein
MNPLVLAALKSSSGGSSGTTDPYFKNVSLLLHGQGSNGAVNSACVDSSTNNYSLTTVGSPSQGTFTPYGSNWSNYFNGSSYFSFATSAAFGFGTGDFTIECWMNLDLLPPSSTLGFIDFRTSLSENPALCIGLTNTGQIAYYDGVNQYTTTTTVSTGVWYHIAFVRHSGIVTIYINGFSSLTQADSTNFGSTNPLKLGENFNGTVDSFCGDLSNFRIVNGIAVYTGNFTPVTAPLTAISGTSLLTCQSNRFIDNSSNKLAITLGGTPSVQRFNPFGDNATPYSTSTYGGSAYLNGSSYLVGPANNTVTNFTGAFTAELWYYPLALGTQTLIYNWGSQVASTSSFIFGVNSSGYLTMYYGIGSTNTNPAVSTSAIVANQWNHIAITRDTTNVLRYCINGVTNTIGTISGTFNTGGANFAIGAGGALSNINNTAADWTNGYISDVSVINGTCKYSGTYTPPTTPLEKVTGSTLLLNFQNGGIVDNTMENNLVVVNSGASISTTEAKFGSSSIYSPNTSYLQVLSSPDFNFTGAFTLETWIYPISNSTGYNILSSFAATNGNFGWAWKVMPLTAETSPTATVGGMIFYSGTYNENQIIRYTSTFPTINQWNHLAVCRDSNSNWYMFINGILQTTTTWIQTASSPVNLTTTNPVIISGVNGYIQDLRVTNGIARYTANFTVPTTMFPNK